jgi:hypothetical protein
MPAFAGSAGGATTVGSNLAGTPSSGPSPNTSSAARTQATSVTLPITAPAAGVIVQILVKHGGSGADPGSHGFRVLSGSGTYSTNGPPAELPDSPWPANDTSGTRLFVPSLGGVAKGIPIEAGNRLGIVRVGGSGGVGAMFYASGTGATREQTIGVHNSGPLFYETTVPNEHLVQYLIEPDADRDGFGDETQDRCRTNASTQATCPVKAKKCKKKKKRKKKRCKKKRKKKK